ncbi:MAG: hypothetical protein ACP5I2_01570 [Fervidicoccaceae archaeon]
MLSAKFQHEGCAETGITSIDYLVGCLQRGIIAEIYGDPDLLFPASYIATASLHCKGGAVLGIVQENPLNYDLYAVRTALRSMKCSEDGLLVSRAFRIEDAVDMIREAMNLPQESLIVFDPYAHSPNLPREYTRLSPLTAVIRSAAGRGKRVVLFNRVTKFGRFLPEGGNMHHHSVTVIVKLEKSGRRSYRATLIKHPTKPQTSISGSLRELYEVGKSWGGQFLLAEWL